MILNIEKNKWLLLISFFSLISCKKSETSSNNVPQSISGEWTLQKERDVYQNVHIPSDREDTTMTFTISNWQVYRFYADSTYWFWDDGHRQNADTGSYRIIPGRIILSSANHAAVNSYDTLWYSTPDDATLKTLVVLPVGNYIDSLNSTWSKARSL